MTRFPSGDGKWQLPTGYGAWPRWSAKGDRLYFGDELNRIVEVPVALQDSFVASAPTLRVASNVSLLGGFDRALDGSQFILPVSPSSATELTRLWLIQHWKPQ